MKEIKNKTCVFCGVEFKPSRTTQRVCSTRCSIGYARQKEEKKEKRLWGVEKKKRKEALMSHAEWLKTLQAVFNTYIRVRDKELPCISCGTTKGQMHAGHFRSVGSAPHLRFNELNVWKQCATCNNHLHGNLIEYRKGLIVRIGEEKVKELENLNNTGKLSIPEIKEKITYYKKQIKDLK